MFIFNKKKTKGMKLEMVSNILADVRTPITYTFTPINLEEEKKKFFDSDDYNPQFKYTVLANRNREIFQALEDVDHIDDVDPRISDFYIDLIKSKELVHDLYVSVGNNDLVTKYSEKRYGSVSPKLFQNATRVIKGYTSTYNLANESKVNGSRKLSLDEVISVMRYFLDLYDLKDWNIVFSKKNMNKNIRVGVKDKEIVLGSDQVSKSAFRLRKTIVHEIGTHVLRWYNGQLTGFPALTKSNNAGYHDVEEGLASYNEEISDLMDASTLRQKALLVYAIYIGKNLSFRQLYTVLRGFESKNTAFNLTLRVKRGLGDTSIPGIYAKDASYFRGFRIVRRKIENNPELYKKLYAGKIGFKQISWVDDGLIPMPKYVFDIETYNTHFKKLSILK